MTLARATASAALVLGMLAPWPAHADSHAPKGTITLTGSGRSSAPPELTSFTITIVSICYDTSTAAAAANAALSTKTISALQQYATGPRDKVTSTGGPNYRETETVNDGASTRTLCTMGWKATNTITIEMANLAQVPSMQDDVYGVVDRAAAIDPQQVAQTYADFGQPYFQVYPETDTRLRGEAEVNAYEDAEAQLTALKGVCSFDHLELTSIAPTYSTFAMAGGRVLDEASPIVPDQIAVQASLSITWSFDPSPECSAILAN
jgi:uncharacterized protein YggE